MPWDSIAMTFLLLTGIFLMFIILLQRGRGGGLAGAFGGAGGQSAFGTKAGDVFTKITVVIAVIWVVLAGVSAFALRAGSERLGHQLGGDRAVIATPGTEKADDAKPEDDKFGELPLQEETGGKKPATETKPGEKDEKKPEKGEQKGDPSKNTESTSGNEPGGKAETPSEDGPKTPK